MESINSQKKTGVLKQDPNTYMVKKKKKKTTYIP